MDIGHHTTVSSKFTRFDSWQRGSIDSFQLTLDEVKLACEIKQDFSFPCLVAFSQWLQSEWLFIRELFKRNKFFANRTKLENSLEPSLILCLKSKNLFFAALLSQVLDGFE